MGDTFDLLVKQLGGTAGRREAVLRLGALALGVGSVAAVAGGADAKSCKKRCKDRCKDRQGRRRKARRCRKRCQDRCD